MIIVRDSLKWGTLSPTRARQIAWVVGLYPFSYEGCTSGKVCSHGNKNEGTMIGYIVSHLEHYHPLPILSFSHSPHTSSSPSNTIAQHSSITHTSTVKAVESLVIENTGSHSILAHIHSIYSLTLPTTHTQGITPAYTLTMSQLNVTKMKSCQS